MINNEMKNVTHIVYSSTPDSYGQYTTVESQEQIEMFTKIYSQENVHQPIFDNVDLVGLTKDVIHLGDEIIIDGEKYSVIFVTPSRYNRVLLSKK